MPAKLPAATLICVKLVVREEGRTIPARFHNSPFFRRSNALQASFDPHVPSRTEVSGDGKYLHIIPEGFLRPGTEYALSISGSYYQGRISIGNLTLGGRYLGKFKRIFHFTVEVPEQNRLPLSISKDAVSAFEWTRLAVPIPTMLPSLNQIGFDYMNWLIGPVFMSQPDGKNSGQVIMWAVGAKQRHDGVLVADAETDFRLPLSGRYQDDAFILTNRHFKMAITGIPIPFQLFQLRGRMGKDRQVLPGATAYAETEVLSIPTFGPLMVIAGLANKIWKKLLAMATYITRPYAADGPANRRPVGVHVQEIDFSPPGRRKAGHCMARISLDEGHLYPVNDHQAAILLVDRQKGEAIDLDYHNNLEQLGDELGNLRQIKLALPKGKRLPEKTSVYVILDLFPLYESKLDG
jgi:hypothetical protein